MKKIPILYINLDKRKDRDNEIKQELLKYELEGHKIKAIEHDNGYIGCVLSHIKALDYAIKKKYNEVIILEDDFIFLMNPKKLDLNINFDVFLLGGTAKEIKKEGDFYRALKTSRTEGYLIKRHYYNILKNNFIEGLCNILKENNQIYYLDWWWNKLQEKDKWYFNSFGFIGGQKEGYSDIQKNKMDRCNNFNPKLLNN